MLVYLPSLFDDPLYFNTFSNSQQFFTKPFRDNIERQEQTVFLPKKKNISLQKRMQWM